MTRVVTVGSNKDPDLVPAVVVDNEAVGRLAAEHLLEKGLRRLACCGPASVFFSLRRMDGFAAAAAEAGIAVERHDGAFPFFGFSPRQAHAQPVAAWLAALPKPVGLFAPTDNVALSLMRLCRNAGIRVPEDVAVIGVNDDALMAASASTPLSSVILPGDRVGHEAADLLERLMTGEEPPGAAAERRPLGVAARQSTDLLVARDAEAVAAYRWIEAHAHEPIGAAQVCEQTRIARRSLERRFKSTFDQTLNGAILRVRLGRARDLLATTDLTLPHVAQRAGFGHMGHFHQQFRRAFGVTPQAWRIQRQGLRPDGRSARAFDPPGDSADAASVAPSG